MSMGKIHVLKDQQSNSFPGELLLRRYLTLWGFPYPFPDMWKVGLAIKQIQSKTQLILNFHHMNSKKFENSKELTTSSHLLYISCVLELPLLAWTRRNLHLPSHPNAFEVPSVILNLQPAENTLLQTEENSGKDFLAGPVIIEHGAMVFN